MVKDKKAKSTESIPKPPSAWSITWKEVRRSKSAMFSLALVVILLLVIFVGAALLNKEKVVEINIADSYYGFGEAGHIFGTDDGGRDIFSYLILGARNSILVGWSVTILTMGIGLFIGVLCGYYGGIFDAIVMRVVDFIQILPTMPILIVLVTVIPKYSPVTLVLLITMFGWTGEARYYRSFTLSQANREYVQASKTSGSSNWKIMWREVLPNISSMLITDFMLGLAGNIGVETGLSFIGYGLPSTVPSIGTLIGYANDSINVTTRPWLWLPATLLLLILSLSINYVGRAVQRAADARQREN